MTKRFVLVLFTFLLVCDSLCAELVSVEVGGKLEIYGLYYHNFIEPSNQERIPLNVLSGRSIGPDGTYSAYRTGKDATGSAYVEQRTRLHTRAVMTNDVSMFVEVDSVDGWGEDFRSQDYLTGKDSRSNSTDDIELFQAYIQCSNIGIEDLTLTIGRQVIDLGSGWLVGSDPGPNPFMGLSFDAVRLQYDTEPYGIELFYAKLLESMRSFNHDDVDFGGIYFTWKEIFEGSSLDIYYFLLRDNRKNEVTQGDISVETFENILNRDDPSTTYIHTIGARFYGEYQSLNYELEFAYQWGESSAFGNLFIPVGGGIYGDDDADWSLPAGHFEVGYTFPEKKWAPGLYVGGCYYGAEDNRSLSFIDWLTKFGEGEASPSFNRLFTAYREDNFIDISAMTNFWQIYSGVSITPVEKIEVGFELCYMQAVSAFDRPYSVSIGSYEIYPSPFPFITKKNSKDLGWQTLLSLSYQYSDDLNFSTGWSHFFVGKGLAEGAFLDNYGTSFISTANQDDTDYFYVSTTIEF